MDANKIINDNMTLEEKLAAIDKAMESAEAVNQKKSPGAAPIDPALATICDGCE